MDMKQERLGSRMRKKIENALFELVITPDLRGFNYICRGVEIIASSKEKVDMVKGLYVDIAKEFNTTQTGVERAIRHAFTKVDVEGEAFAKYLNIGKLTNSALLYALAYRLKDD